VAVTPQAQEDQVEAGLRAGEEAAQDRGRRLGPAALGGSSPWMRWTLPQGSDAR